MRRLAAELMPVTDTVRLMVASSYATVASTGASPDHARTPLAASTGATPRNTTVQSRDSGTADVSPVTGATVKALGDASAPPHVNAIAVSALVAPHVPRSSRMTNEPSAPGNTSTRRACGLAIELIASPDSATSCNGTIAPALANTGVRSSERQTSSRRPAASDETYRRPSKKSNHSPCGSQASARPRQAAASSGETIGATTSSVPKRNSSGTS